MIRTFILLAALICSGCHSYRPPVADAQLELITTYSVYAKSLWHDADVGGYWGGGIAEKNQNGAGRGMCATRLGYAVVVHAMDRHWLDAGETQRVKAAGVTPG